MFKRLFGKNKQPDAEEVKKDDAQRVEENIEFVNADGSQKQSSVQYEGGKEQQMTPMKGTETDFVPAAPENGESLADKKSVYADGAQEAQQAGGQRETASSIDAQQDTDIFSDSTAKQEENVHQAHGHTGVPAASVRQHAEHGSAGGFNEERLPEKDLKNQEHTSTAAEESSGEKEPFHTAAPRPETNETATPQKSFFARLKMGLSRTKSAITQSVDNILSSFRSIDEELYEELEEALIMADIGVETSTQIIEQLRERVKSKKLNEAKELRGEIKDIITQMLESQDSSVNISGDPAVIMVIGVNGVGKTTSIGKMAHYYQDKGKKVLLAAADTFRAAAIDQLQIWADRAGADIVKHQEGSDPSAVVFDAIHAAKARGADLVICDTAGRLHNKKNLMEELSKTARVIERETGKAPSEVLLVLDASTGQNALIQAREFARVARITGVILTKLDGTAKGGVLISLCREQGIGVKLIGVGEGIDDLQEFDPRAFAEALFPEEES